MCLTAVQQSEYKEIEGRAREITDTTKREKAFSLIQVLKQSEEMNCIGDFMGNMVELKKIFKEYEV